MFISHTASAANGFKKWSTTRGKIDNNQSGGATPIAVPEGDVPSPIPENVNSAKK